MRRRALLAGGLALLVGGPAHARTYRDMTGREVALSAPARRIVSLVPSVTELIYALGGEARLVGRTDFCDYPSAAREAQCGGMVARPRGYRGLGADLVIGTTEEPRGDVHPAAPARCRSIS
jgi:ABC-type hemin transport system substrate-binding protein